MKAPVAQAESNKEKWLVLPPSLQLAAWGLTLCVFYLSSTYTEQNGIGLLPRTAVSLWSVKDYRFLHPHPLARHLIRWRVPHSIPELNFKGGTKSYQKMNSFCLNFAENWLGWANIDIFYPFFLKKIFCLSCVCSEAGWTFSWLWQLYAHFQRIYIQHWGENHELMTYYLLFKIQHSKSKFSNVSSCNPCTLN